MIDHDPSARVLVDALRGPSPEYKRAAVEAVVARRETTTPLVLDMLREVLADPAGYVERLGDDHDALYALAITAHLRSPEAHAVLLALARIDGEVFDWVFGGFLTEGFDRALFATAHGRSEGLCALVVDRTAGDYLRWQAAEALAMMVAAGQVDRVAVMDLLAAQLVPEAAEGGDFFWGGIGCTLMDLWPVSHGAAIERAWDSGLIDPILFDRGDIAASIARGPAAGMERLQSLAAQAMTPDPHHWIGWWACYREPVRARRGLSPREGSTAARAAPPGPSAQQQQAAKRRQQSAKRKRVRAERRKARARKR